MRITSKGQVTIPKAVRDRTGIHPGVEVDVAVSDGGVLLRPAKARSRPGRGRGERIVDSMIGKGTANRDLSTDEIMRLLRGDE